MRGGKELTFLIIFVFVVAFVVVGGAASTIATINICY